MPGWRPACGCGAEIVGLEKPRPEIHDDEGRGRCGRFARAQARQSVRNTADSGPELTARSRILVPKTCPIDRPTREAPPPRDEAVRGRLTNHRLDRAAAGPPGRPPRAPGLRARQRCGARSREQHERPAPRQRGCGPTGHQRPRRPDLAPARAGRRVRGVPDSIRDRSQRPTSQGPFQCIVAAHGLRRDRSPECPARILEYSWPLPSPFFALAPMAKAERRPSTAERHRSRTPLLQRRGIELDAPGLADVGGQRRARGADPARLQMGGGQDERW